MDDVVNHYSMAQKPFEKNYAFISKVTDLTPSLIAAYNTQTGQFVYINNSLKSLLGYDQKDWLEKGVQFVVSKVHPDDLPRILAENQKAIEADQKLSQHSDQNPIVEFEYRLMDAYGNYKWLKTYGTVFDRDSLGKVLHVINISIDITTIKENEENLQQLNLNLDQKIRALTEQEKLEKQKDEFISIASHELKTPLTTIKSFTEILKMQFSKEEKAIHYLDKMNHEIDRLTGLVNELLDVSKIQSTGLSLNKEVVELKEFIKEVIEDIQATTPQHKIIQKQKDKIKISIDKHRIYQVLINLISNAIKYSPKADKVIISVEKTPEKVNFKIKDYGIGITKRDKKKVFDAFFQATTTIRQSHSGLGLGLHISKEIIHRHGGEISVYSKKGIGSTFSFSLPLKQK